MQAKLTAELFREIVASLRSDTTATRIHENRREGRVGLRVNLDLIVCACDDAGEERVTVWVRDISIRGVGFVCSTRMAEGLEFIAQFAREIQPAVSILYKVQYCRRITHDLFSVGAKFQRVVADEVGREQDSSRILSQQKERQS
ncbi:MAG: hypothetical protein ABSH20_27450 [Tepidisphaeraceae bacterium]|jgi:hypothetical protein